MHISIKEIFPLNTAFGIYVNDRMKMTSAREEGENTLEGSVDQ